MTTAVIVDVVRTPVGQGQARRRPVRRAPGRPARRRRCTALVERNGLDPALVDDVIAGCVGQVGEQALNIGRTPCSPPASPRSVPAHHHRPAVRLQPAGGALRRPGRDRRRLRHRHRRRGRVDEPGADGLVARTGARPVRARRRWRATPRAWSTRGSRPSSSPPGGSLAREDARRVLGAARTQRAAAAAADGGFDDEIVAGHGRRGRRDRRTRRRDGAAGTTAEGLAGLKPAFEHRRADAERFPEIDWRSPPATPRRSPTAPRPR